MPLYSGRIRANSFFNGPSEYDDGQPIRCAITGVGIVGHSRSSARICGSYGSTTDPRVIRRYSGGRSEDNAARTVFRATRSRRAISLMGTPSARCRRRISAQFSTFSTLQDSGGGQLSEYPGGSVFRIRRHGPVPHRRAAFEHVPAGPGAAGATEDVAQVGGVGVDLLFGGGHLRVGEEVF